MATAYVRVEGVYTNTSPVDAYRGSIQTPTTVNERLIENGARELGIDPAEMRRRNYIQAHEYPYHAPLDDSPAAPIANVRPKLKISVNWPESTKEPSR